MKSLRGLGGPLTKFLIFAVITLLCTGLLAGTIANRVGGDTTDYAAKFTDVTGVNVGDEVRIAGVRVGQVDAVDLADRKTALIKFSVAEDMSLPASTTATIKFRNLIGQRFIALEMGSGSPAAKLAPGATIPVSQTRPAVNLTQLFNGFKPLFQALSPADVNQLSFELVQVLQGEGGTVTSLLSHTASLTSTIADKDHVIGEVIDNLNEVLTTLNDRDDQFTDLIKTVRELVSGFAKDRNTIGDAIESIGDLTDTTADLLHDARPPLKDDIRHLGDLAGNLNDHKPIVNKFLTTLPDKFDQLIPLGTHTSYFDFYLCDISIQLTLPLGQTITLPAPLPPVTVPNLPIPNPIKIGPLSNTQPRCTTAGNTDRPVSDYGHGGHDYGSDGARYGGDGQSDTGSPSPASPLTDILTGSGGGR